MGFLIEKYAFRQGCCVAVAAPDDKVIVRGPCYSCKKPQEVIVNGADLIRFRDNEFAQDCFPYLSADKREFMISGICNACWNEMFEEEDEDDEDAENRHGEI
jgi:hypothetical protein